MLYGFQIPGAEYRGVPLCSSRLAPILLNILLFATLARSGQEESYSIRRYDLDIKPDFKTRVLALRATVDIENPALQDSFLFGLNSRYDTIAVSSPSSMVRVERANGWITVHVTQPVEKLSLSFDLKGNLGKSNDEKCDIIGDSTLFLLWSDRFYPIDFDRWAKARTELHVPAGFKAIAPGRLTEADTSASGIRYVFESNVPVANVSVIADSRWIRTERRMNGILIQTMLYPESRRFCEQIFTTSSEILGFYSSIMCPYPFDRFSFVTISGMFARRAFPGFVGYEPQYLEKEFTTTGHDAHETALLWWGYTTHGSGPGSFQWTEGFGDYVEILYDEAYQKPIPRIFERFREEYLAVPPAQDIPYAELRGNTPQKIVHGKYPWLMHLLRYVVGDSAFGHALRLLFERFRYQTFTMDEFVSTLEEGCGQSLAWWRTEWLERKGVPGIIVSTQIEKNRAGYRVTCLLEQRGNLYHFPLEIGIESAKGVKIEKVNLANVRAKFTFDSKEEPMRILLDPNHWILMHVSTAK